MPLGAHKAAIMGTSGVSTGDVVLLQSESFTEETTVSFTSGITSTYGEYIFKFYNINPETDGAHLTFQVNATDGADYDDSAITSTFFVAYHSEDAAQAALSYDGGKDQQQGTAFQGFGYNVGSGADESVSGEMHLFNPASTTYVKHFYCHAVSYDEGNTTAGRAWDGFTAGYINDTTAIDDIQFKMSSGNFDGTIKMYGVG